MKYFKLLGLAALPVLVFGALLASSAFALPQLLGWEGHANYTGENDAANPTLETAAKETIVCSAAKGDGTQTNDTTASFHIHFTGCKAKTALGTFGCNTEGDASEVILNLGTADYVFDHLGTGSELGVAILFLPEEATIKCTALVTLKVRGHLLCLVLEPLTSSTTHLFHCTQTSGVQSEKKYWNDAEKEETANLETSKNGGAFEQSGEQALATVVFGVPVAFMNE